MIVHGDCLEILRTLEPDSLDSLVTDPPAGIGFMGKDWDHHKGGRDAWVAWMTDVMSECHRVLKPGAHGLVWALPRTSHWTATALEDAGFEVRDVITHHFGTGFPKSLSVSKAIDKAAGAEREVVGISSVTGVRTSRTMADDGGKGARRIYHNSEAVTNFITAPASDASAQWDGWGTALKPASEHWILIRKPLSEKSVAAQVLATGTGAINVDACRVGTEGGCAGATAGPSTGIYGEGLNGERSKPVAGLGRWPANLLLSHGAGCVEVDCEPGCPVAELDAQSGVSKSPPVGSVARTSGGETIGTFAFAGRPPSPNGHGDTGGASRFFPTFKYTPKAPPKERPKVDGVAHPTVKSLALMRWLITLVTPPGGTVLDPFAGSGATVEAALLDGFEYMAIEAEASYIPLIEARVARVS